MLLSSPWSPGENAAKPRSTFDILKGFTDSAEVAKLADALA